MRCLLPFAILVTSTPAFADDADHVVVVPDDPPPAEPAVALPPTPLPTVETRVGDRRPSGVFLIGAGYNPDDGFLAHSMVEQPNLFGTGQRLALVGDLSAIRQKLALQYDVPKLLPGIDLRTELLTTQRRYTGFGRTGVGGSVQLSHAIDRHTRIYARYRLEHVTIEPTGEATARTVGGSNVGNGLVASLGGGIVHDTLDAPFLPRRGTRFELFGDRADRRWGSEYSFERAGGSLDHARPLGPFTLRLHGHVAYVRSLDADGVPLAHRLFHDGHADVRGYALDSMSPVGDNLAAVGRVELEMPVWRRGGLSIAGWADAGLRHNSDVMGTEPSLRRSVGASILWRSPIGPLRFDWAVPLDARDRTTQFLFNVGGWAF